MMLQWTKDGDENHLTTTARGLTVLLTRFNDQTAIIDVRDAASPPARADLSQLVMFRQAQTLESAKKWCSRNLGRIAKLLQDKA